MYKERLRRLGYTPEEIEEFLSEQSDYNRRSREEYEHEDKVNTQKKEKDNG